MAKKKTSKLSVETIIHDDATRTNIPTAELQPIVRPEDQRPIAVTMQRNAVALETEKAGRNRDLDPQLVWKGKDEQDWSDLVVQAPPIYIQEKVHPKVLIDALVRRTEAVKTGVDTRSMPKQLDLFADFNGLPSAEAKTEFYEHEGHWQNRMILGDSLQVMASLAEREGLRGKVQCIYFDPPYGIKFNSNFQWSTTSRDVKDGNAGHITREPEQVKAFRDTWRDGIHSYLTYLRDRLTVARDLLTDSGSIFVQIGDENVHRVRALMDEVFGSENFCSLIGVEKTTGQTDALLATVYDYVVWFGKKKECVKFRLLQNEKPAISNSQERYVCVETPDGEIIDLSVAQKVGQEPIPEGRILKLQDLTSQTGSDISRQARTFSGKSFKPSGSRGWSISPDGFSTVTKAGYLHYFGNTLYWKL
jgi:adenine-specific DNA-methyltransferase